MSYSSGEFSRRVSGNLDKLAFFSGIVLLVVGLVTFNGFGTLVSMVTLFFGMVLLVNGLFGMLGLFPNSWRSLAGVGMLAICIAFVFFAFALVALEYTQTTYSISAVYAHGASPHDPPISYRVIPSTDRVYAWLSYLCAYVGVGLVFLALC